jgi:anti-sigma-K factor RskA
MSTADPQPDLPADEELVAYLDGELPPEACRRIETQLADDAALRRHLHELEAAWEALDTLPQPTVDDDFARTTIEMVALAAERDAGAQATVASRTRRNRTLLLAVSGIAVAAVGFAAFRVVVPDGNQLLLADLPAIAQIDALGQFKDIDFLRRLSERIPLEDLADDQQSLDQQVEQLRSTGSPSPDVRRQWIEQLSQDEKADLAARVAHFRAFSPAEQQRLHDLEREISQATDAVQLQRTMLAYGGWLARRSPGDQAELRELPVDKRLDRIAELVRQQERRAAMQLSAEDASLLRKAALALAEERRPQFDDLIQQRRRRDTDGPPRQIGPRWIALWAIGHDLRDEKSRDAMRDRLTRQLSPSAKEHLASRRDWPEQLWRWTADSLRPRSGPEELERFFAERLDNDQRERLLSLPPADMEAALERLYVGEQLGLRETEWGRGGDDRGPFGWPPPRPEGRPRDRGRRDRPPPPDGPPPGDFGPGPEGLGPLAPPFDLPRPDRQPPAWEVPPDHGPPPDHQQEPM